MPLTKEDITKCLDDKKIKYEIVEHKPVFTIDEDVTWENIMGAYVTMRRLREGCASAALYHSQRLSRNARLGTVPFRAFKKNTRQ